MKQSEKASIREKLQHMPPLPHGTESWQGSQVCDFIRQEFGCDGPRALAIFHDCRSRKNPILVFKKTTRLWEGVESAKVSDNPLYPMMMEMLGLMREMQREMVGLRERKHSEPQGEVQGEFQKKDVPEEPEAPQPSEPEEPQPKPGKNLNWFQQYQRELAEKDKTQV